MITMFKSNILWKGFLVVVAALLLVYLNNGLLNIQNDTTVYVSQIQYFDGDQGKNIQSHSFKPFYGFVGSLLTPLLTPHQAILIINVVLYIGLIFASFFLLRSFGISEAYSLVGASWVAFAYPVLKYGLALLTDVSGWFFAVATCYIFMKFVKSKNINLLYAVSVVGFLGSLCKETGTLGLIFSGVCLFFMFIEKNEWIYLKYITALVTPFFILQGILYFLTTRSGGKTFLDWFLYNVNTNTSEKFHSLNYFIPVEIATFNILWIYFLIGLYALYKSRDNRGYIFVALFIATLPALLWPLFYIRILFIQMLFVLPVSVYGLLFMVNKTNRLWLKVTFIALPIITSIFLFVLANGRSLFDVLRVNL